METPTDVLSNNIAISSSSSHRYTTSCNTLPDTPKCHFTGQFNCSVFVACSQTNKLLLAAPHVSAVTTCHHQAVPKDKTLQFLCVSHLRSVSDTGRLGQKLWKIDFVILLLLFFCDCPLVLGLYIYPECFLLSCSFCFLKV